MRVVATGLASGAGTWRALADRALAEVAPAPGEAIVLASCNGAVEDLTDASWARAFELGGPIASASCASGMQGLWWAKRLLEAGAPSVVVLACDVASAASLANFGVLRVLADTPTAPWQGDSTGFVHGAAAAAVRVIAGGAVDVRLGVELGDLIEGIDPGDLVIGQGTGPAVADDEELALIDRMAPKSVPLACATHAYGHTLGASSLLPLVLAIRGARTGLPPRAHDGRRLAAAIPDHARATIVCRALAGTAGVISTFAPLPPIAPTYREPTRVPAFTPTVRAAIELARPDPPPPALVVVLERPLAPPERARRGGRLLPSAVLEITPGYLAVAIARAWGYTGPSLAVVGAAPIAPLPDDSAVIYVRSDGVPARG